MTRLELIKATHINESWSIDVVSDQLFDGRRVRVQTIVDDFTCGSLTVEVAGERRGDDVARVLDRTKIDRGALQKKICVDKDGKFTSKWLDQWAYLNSERLDFSRFGRPTDNWHIDAFNGRLRAERRSENWFLPLDGARRKIEAWRGHYNPGRPHIAVESFTLQLVQERGPAHMPFARMGGGA